jgi:cysteine sulfinate desulfinase/cysteine desulfurase-like protein
MKVPTSRALGSIRLSLGRYTTECDTDQTLEVLTEIVENLRNKTRLAQAS